MIPTAAYAALSLLLAAAFLWRARRHERRAQGGAPLDAAGRARELRAARIWSAAAIVAELALLIGYGLVRAHLRLRVLPWLPPSWYMLIIGAISLGEFTLEKRLRGLQGSALQFAGLLGRQLLSWLAAAVLAFGSFFALERALTLALARFAPPVAATAARVAWLAGPLLLAGAAALAVVFAFSPLLVRLAYPCERLADPELSAALERCFAAAGLPAPSFWLLRVEQFSLHNAMVAGLSIRRGPLRTALFLTPSLPRALSPAEFEAVMLHEVSHIALRHQIRRGALLILTVPALLAPLALASSLLMPFSSARWTPLLAAAPVLLYLGAQTLLRRWQVRWHELDADAHAVLALGAGAEPLISGLAKMMALNDLTSSRADPTAILSANYAHPTVDERARLLRERAERRAQGRPLRLWLDPWRSLAAGPWAPVLLVAAGLAVFGGRQLVLAARARHAAGEAAARGARDLGRTRPARPPRR